MRGLGVTPAADLDLLFVVSNFSGYSGPNNPLLDLGNFLHQEMGVPCAVVTHAGPVQPPFEQAVRFPTFRRLTGFQPSGWIRLGRAPSNASRLRRAVQDLRPRRVLAASGIDLAFELSWALRRPIPVGHNVLFNWAHRGWARQFGLPLLPPPFPQGPVYAMLDCLASAAVVHGILAHTEFHRRLYRTLGIPADRIRVVPHAVDTKALRESARTGVVPDHPDDKLEVLYAGRLEPDKGIRELLEGSVLAAREVPLRLRFVGGGSERPMLEAFIRARSGKEGLQVECLPPLPRPEVAGLIRASDVVALLSRVEAFGMVALEAMTFSKPVLATRYGGIAEVVRDRADGWLVNPLDIDEIAHALVALGSDAALRRRLGESGRARVETEFDVARVAPRFLRAMESFS